MTCSAARYPFRPDRRSMDDGVTSSGCRRSACTSPAHAGGRAARSWPKPCSATRRRGRDQAAACRAGSSPSGYARRILLAGDVEGVLAMMDRDADRARRCPRGAALPWTEADPDKPRRWMGPRDRIEQMHAALRRDSGRGRRERSGSERATTDAALAGHGHRRPHEPTAGGGDACASPPLVCVRRPARAGPEACVSPRPRPLRSGGTSPPLASMAHTWQNSSDPSMVVPHAEQCDLELAACPRPRRVPRCEPGRLMVVLFTHGAALLEDDDRARQHGMVPAQG